MAVTQIEAVRVFGGDGVPAVFPWDPASFYLVRDDQPWLDVLVRGHRLSVADSLERDESRGEEQTAARRQGALRQLEEPADEGAVWQRWDFEADLARARHVGERRLPLKVPRGSVLQCYVIPAQLLDLADVMTMAQEVETELGRPVVWDRRVIRRGGAWSRRDAKAFQTPQQVILAAKTELPFALDVRRRPCEEPVLSPERTEVLPENALVSHWAARRRRQLTEAADLVRIELEELHLLASHHKADRRVDSLRGDIAALELLADRVSSLSAQVGALIRTEELSIGISAGPAVQRDHRLRRLIAAFAPPPAEALSPMEAARSEFPPVLLNRLWELWGAVWLAKTFRGFGFAGKMLRRGAEDVRACSWILRRDDVVVQIDFEADPTLVAYDSMPPVHERGVPALEWAAQNQSYNRARPFLGMEEKASPDFLIRISSPERRALLVGDACLASPLHHGKGSQAHPKPTTVERYRRSIGWVSDQGIVRCHPLGGFVVFPPPASAWGAFESTPDAPDCTLLCPAPRSNAEPAEGRLIALLKVVAPEVVE